MEIKVEFIDKDLLNDILYADEKSIKKAGVDDTKRCLPQAILDKVETVEMTTHVTAQGKVQRTVVINMVNGYGVTGTPSVSVSKDNDRVEIGTKVALENAVAAIWPLEGYLKCQNIYEAPLIAARTNEKVHDVVALLGRRLEGEFGEKVGSFVRLYIEGGHCK